MANRRLKNNICYYVQLVEQVQILIADVTRYSDGAGSIFVPCNSKVQIRDDHYLLFTLGLIKVSCKMCTASVNNCGPWEWVGVGLLMVLIPGVQMFTNTPILIYTHCQILLVSGLIASSTK